MSEKLVQLTYDKSALCWKENVTSKGWTVRVRIILNRKPLYLLISNGKLKTKIFWKSHILLLQRLSIKIFRYRWTELWDRISILGIWTKLCCKFLLSFFFLFSPVIIARTIGFCIILRVQIHRKSVLHLLNYRIAVYSSRCSTHLRCILGHSVHSNPTHLCTWLFSFIFWSSWSRIPVGEGRILSQLVYSSQHCYNVWIESHS